MNKSITSAWRHWLSNPGIAIGAVILSLMLAVALAAPWLYTIDPNAMDPGNSLLAPGARAEFMTLAGDSFQRLFLVLGPLAGRRLFGRCPRLQPRRRLRQRRLQRALAADVAAVLRAAAVG